MATYTQTLAALTERINALMRRLDEIDNNVVQKLDALLARGTAAPAPTPTPGPQPTPPPTPPPSGPAPEPPELAAVRQAVGGMQTAAAMAQMMALLSEGQTQRAQYYAIAINDLRSSEWRQVGTLSARRYMWAELRLRGLIPDDEPRP